MIGKKFYILFQTQLFLFRVLDLLFRVVLNDLFRAYRRVIVNKDRINSPRLAF